MSGSSQTYLFNSNYNIDPSTMVIRQLKICVSFADKYIYLKRLRFDRSAITLGYFPFKSFIETINLSNVNHIIILPDE